MRPRPARQVLTLALVSAFVLPGAVAAQGGDSAVRVDSLFTRWNTTTTPGCAVGVARAGRTILSRSYGMADLERDVRSTPASIYEAGSVSKQFTATAILLLAQQGKLSIDDDVRKYVPEIPDYGTPIRIRHLMNHTSGLRDWGNVAGIAGWGRSERNHNLAHTIDILSRQRGLNFTPNAEYSYSNSGYTTQAVIVERVSGLTLAEFSKRFMFEPLGMKNTQWRDDHDRIVKGRAVAYAARGQEFAIDQPIEDVYGNGGLLTTVGDLLIWNEHLNTGSKFGGKAYVDAMVKQGVLNNGTQIQYAAGLEVGMGGGARRISHTGSTSGYRAFLARYPDQQLSVALLCNIGSVNPGTVGQQVAAVFLPPQVQAAGRGAAPAGGRGAAAAATDSATGARGGARGGRGAGAGFTPSAAADLAAYVGEYYSPDAETTLIVAMDGAQLIARRRPATRITLSPTEKDVFGAGAGLGTVRFIRDATGRVTQLSVRQDRVFDLRFDRVK
jgi:CubicO group peptidase (beta-lactamase class C family)